ncbi:MAG: hypothetical protein M1831_001748 [Alyxoria varia]|nr:MAG: hypothetical protein M1831_001748 [Alyxoria varia]
MSSSTDSNSSPSPKRGERTLKKRKGKMLEQSNIGAAARAASSRITLPPPLLRRKMDVGGKWGGVDEGRVLGEGRVLDESQLDSYIRRGSSGDVSAHSGRFAVVDDEEEEEDESQNPANDEEEDESQNPANDDDNAEARLNALADAAIAHGKTAGGGEKHSSGFVVHEDDAGDSTPKAGEEDAERDAVPSVEVEENSNNPGAVIQDSQATQNRHTPSDSHPSIIGKKRKTPSNSETDSSSSSPPKKLKTADSRHNTTQPEWTIPSSPSPSPSPEPSPKPSPPPSPSTYAYTYKRKRDLYDDLLDDEEEEEEEGDAHAHAPPPAWKKTKVDDVDDAAKTAHADVYVDANPDADAEGNANDNDGVATENGSAAGLEREWEIPETPPAEDSTVGGKKKDEDGSTAGRKKKNEDGTTAVQKKRKRTSDNDDRDDNNDNNDHNDAARVAQQSKTVAIAKTTTKKKVRISESSTESATSSGPKSSAENTTSSGPKSASIFPKSPRTTYGRSLLRKARGGTAGNTSASSKSATSAALASSSESFNLPSSNLPSSNQPSSNPPSSRSPKSSNPPTPDTPTTYSSLKTGYTQTPRTSPWKRHATPLKFAGPNPKISKIHGRIIRNLAVSSTNILQSSKNPSVREFLSEEKLEVLDYPTQAFDILVVGKGAVKKTAKLLLAVANATPVVTEDWLVDCAEGGCKLPYTAYVPDAADVEEGWGLKLEDVPVTDRSKLLQGKSVVFTPALRRHLGESYRMMEAVCSAVGAEGVACKGARGVQVDCPDEVVLGVERGDTDARRMVARGKRCFSLEWLCMGVLRGVMDMSIQVHEIAEPEVVAGRRRARKSEGGDGDDGAGDRDGDGEDDSARAKKQKMEKRLKIKLGMKKGGTRKTI